MDVIEAYEWTRARLDGQSVAELEIEARRDAIEADYDIRSNPYPAGTFPSLCYTDECQRNWKTKLELNHGTDCKAN